MKALVYTQPLELQFREEPDPEPHSDDVVVAVEAVGICGSDMHAYQGHDARRVPPLILGHEVAGKVLTGKHSGQRVILNPLITCRFCDYCLTARSNLCQNRTMIGMTRPGGFAERLAVPEQCLITIPDDMNATQAALTEPAATALHGINLASRVLSRSIAEAQVLVIGGGSVGLLAALFANNWGSENIVLAETNQLRQSVARNSDFVTVVDPTKNTIEEQKFTLVIDAVGSDKSRSLAFHSVSPGGVILHIGLMNNDGGLDTRKMTLSEITFIGTYTYTDIDLREAMKKLYNGSLGDLDWVERRSLAEGPNAFRNLYQGKIGAPKVVLCP